MIFQKRKPIEVNYFIDTPSINLMDYPKGLFPNIEKFPDHRKTGCPAVKSTDKRIYRVKAPFNVDIRVYMDNGRVMIEWEYDVNQLKVSIR